jgi:hypothetical protein
MTSGSSQFGGESLPLSPELIKTIMTLLGLSDVISSRDIKKILRYIDEMRSCRIILEIDDGELVAIERAQRFVVRKLKTTTD